MLRSGAADSGTLVYMFLVHRSVSEANAYACVDGSAAFLGALWLEFESTPAHFDNRTLTAAHPCAYHRQQIIRDLCIYLHDTKTGTEVYTKTLCLPKT